MCVILSIVGINTLKGNMAVYNEFGHIIIIIDDARIDEICNVYFKWNDLNTHISNNSHRGIKTNKLRNTTKTDREGGTVGSGVVKNIME